MRGRAVQYFSLCLSDEQIGNLGGSSKKKIIFEAEMVAVILAILLWMERIRNAMVLCFIDNNSARDIAISASSRSGFSMALVEMLLQSEHRGSFFPWYARVPSPSNPVDSPSRNNTEQLGKHGVSPSDGSALTAAVISEVLEAKKSHSGEVGVCLRFIRTFHELS